MSLSPFPQMLTPLIAGLQAKVLMVAEEGDPTRRAVLLREADDLSRLIARLTEARLSAAAEAVTTATTDIRPGRTWGLIAACRRRLLTFAERHRRTLVDRPVPTDRTARGR